MRSIRFSLQRYFLEFAKIDILGHDFVDANTVFENTLRLVKTTGTGEKNHHPEIESADLTVWMNTMFYFIRRDRENMRAMTKHSFAIGIDATGRDFNYESTQMMDEMSSCVF